MLLIAGASPKTSMQANGNNQDFSERKHFRAAKKGDGIARSTVRRRPPLAGNRAAVTQVAHGKTACATRRRKSSSNRAMKASTRSIAAQHTGSGGRGATFSGEDLDTVRIAAAKALKGHRPRRVGGDARVYGRPRRTGHDIAGGGLNDALRSKGALGTQSGGGAFCALCCRLEVGR